MKIPTTTGLVLDGCLALHMATDGDGQDNDVISDTESYWVVDYDPETDTAFTWWTGK